MSGFRPFTRQLGLQSGVQLNPLVDQTDGVAPDNSDQVVAFAGRFTRGAIDRPFRVNRSNFKAKTGAAESIRLNALNEAKLQGYEALENGTYEAVVARLAPATAAKLWAVINFSGAPAQTSSITEFSTSPTQPTAGFSIAVLHHDCFNDGIRVSLHADATPLSGQAVPTTDVTLRVYDSKSVMLAEFSGSLDPAAKDDFGINRYLPDIVAVQGGGSFECIVAANARLPIASDAYGRNTAGRDNWATSNVLTCFTEGGTTYTPADFDRVITGMRNTLHPFGYLMSGGSRDVSFVSKLCALAMEINTPCKVDVPGNLTVAQAIAWAQQFNLDPQLAHLIHFNWAPLEAEDPMNGGRAVWGAGGLQIGYSCARNARVNADGFAPKNQPIAGKEWALNRTSVRQLVRPEEQELSDLARAQINPVISDNFNGGARFVFFDCLTAAKSQVSFRKLQSVAEMSVTIDVWVTLYANELRHLPMQEFIKRMSDFLDVLLAAAQTAKWLKPSKNLPGNAAYAYTVKASSTRPADFVLIDYAASYDGVARQVSATQTLVK